MKEIVAARIKMIITIDPRAIVYAIESGERDIQFLERRHMELMAAFDLGPQWNRLAEAPTLFCVDADGKPCAPPVKT